LTPPKTLPSDALRAMWEEDLSRGVDPTGDLLNRPEPARPQVVEPLVRPTPPPADWRAEQVVASLRSDAGQPEPEPPPPESLQARPARRRRQWKGPR